jgi:predicted glycoside hydrolase/deacetylase ChbG (UPF0249 family)
MMLTEEEVRASFGLQAAKPVTASEIDENRRLHEVFLAELRLQIRTEIKAMEDELSASLLKFLKDRGIEC